MEGTTLEKGRQAFPAITSFAFHFASEGSPPSCPRAFFRQENEGFSDVSCGCRRTRPFPQENPLHHS